MPPYPHQPEACMSMHAKPPLPCGYGHASYALLYPWKHPGENLSTWRSSTSSVSALMWTNARLSENNVSGASAGCGWGTLSTQCTDQTTCDPPLRQITLIAARNHVSPSLPSQLFLNWKMPPMPPLLGIAFVIVKKTQSTKSYRDMEFIIHTVRNLGEPQ